MLSGSPSLKPRPPASGQFPVTSNKKIAVANCIPDTNNFLISLIGNLFPLIIPEVSLMIASTYLTFGYFLQKLSNSSNLEILTLLNNKEILFLYEKIN